MADRLRIRPARTDDQAEVDRLYEICLRTGDAGADATAQHRDPRLLGEVYLGAYLRLEPGLAFVLVDGDTPVGYVVGARDTPAFERELEESWWPGLRARHPRGSYPPGSPDARLVALIHQPEPSLADVTRDFPAHLHIDLLPVAQGGGNGRRMLETLFDALRTTGTTGVHLGVARENARARGFYRHLGFRALDADGDLLGLAL